MNFPYTGESFNGSYETAVAVNLIIFSLILISVPSVFIFLISLVKPKIKEKTSFYFYAFSSAVFIMVGTVGLIGESFETTSVFVENYTDTVVQAFLTIGIVAGGAIIGLIVAILFRFLFIKKVGEVHIFHEDHSHDDHIINLKDVDNPKAAWFVIFLILGHRTIDGFVLGGTIAKITSGDSFNVGLVVTFILHILVEILIIYYRQIQFGEKKFKAALYNFYTLVAIIPIMFIGAYINPYLNQIGWFLPLVNASGGAIITFVGIIELVPEFLHNKKMITKEWYKVIISFALGIIFSLIILSFHGHESGHEHTQQEIETAQSFVNLKLNYYG